MSDELTN